MSRVDYETLADLFSITYQRTGSIEGGLRVVVAALQAGNAGTKIMVALRENAPWRREAVAACMPTLEEVAKDHHLTVRDLRGREASPRITWARYDAYKRLQDLGHSFRTIAMALRRASHNTVSAGIRRRLRKEWTA